MSRLPDTCARRHLPARLRAEILLRQGGACADCGTRLILGFFVFDHRPPLALRAGDADANDPSRLAAICTACNEQKTPRDLKAIAKAKRLAEEHQHFLERQRTKVPGRRAPTRKQTQRLERAVAFAVRPRLGPARVKPGSISRKPVLNRPALPRPKDREG